MLLPEVNFSKQREVGLEYKMADGKKIVIGLGVVAGIGALIYATTKVKAAIPPENIVLSDLVIEPSEVYVGQPVSISVIATNIGEITGSYEIICEVV